MYRPSLFHDNPSDCFARVPAAEQPSPAQAHPVLQEPIPPDAERRVRDRAQLQRILRLLRVLHLRSRA